MKKNLARGMTLFEVLLAMFIFLVGIVGVLMAIPTGVNSASTVILQDAAINLAHSKFSEFRRDRADPKVELASAAYLGAVNTTPGGLWRDFPHAAGGPYQYFDDIERYEWRLDMGDIDAVNLPGGTPASPPGTLFPAPSGSSNVGLTRVSVIVRRKGTTREFRFTQYMAAYGKSAAPLLDP